MMSLRQLVLDAYPDYLRPERIPDLPVRSLSCDSRQVKPGDIFVAIRGKKLDGAAFIEDAARRGASAVIAEETPQPSLSIPCVQIPDSRDGMSRLAASFFGHPSRAMRIAGVTGTNGKTTTAYLIDHLLNHNGLTCGLIGTVGTRFPGTDLPPAETTPGPLKLQEIFFHMVKAGCRAVVMEVSSHALDQQRVGGIHFECAVFTNLTQDHLDYHGTMENYFLSKVRLFEGLDPKAVAVLNADDVWAQKIRECTRAKIVTYGLSSSADYKADRIVFHGDSTEFELVTAEGRIPISIPMAGRHNVYNALGALAACKALGVSEKQAAKSLALFSGVPGRLESVRCGQDFSALIDFAHTPDGLLNVLRSLKEDSTKKLILVFGCGGDRDRTKRAVMAEIASRYADFVYVTSDNPRSENPKTIAQEICAGFPAEFKQYRVVLDRQRAIREAFLSARSGDIVLLAGKGHERSQVVGDRALPFNDREEAEKVLHGF